MLPTTIGEVVQGLNELQILMMMMMMMMMMIIMIIIIGIIPRTMREFNQVKSRDTYRTAYNQSPTFAVWTKPTCLSRKQLLKNVHHQHAILLKSQNES